MIELMSIELRPTNKFCITQRVIHDTDDRSRWKLQLDTWRHSLSNSIKERRRKVHRQIRILLKATSVLSGLWLFLFAPMYAIAILHWRLPHNTGIVLGLSLVAMQLYSWTYIDDYFDGHS